MGALKEMTTAVPIHPAHILIMEDDLNVARGLKMVLDEEGYDVDLRDTGHGALDALGQYEYDLLMADLRLPDIDGMQVIRQVKDITPGTGVIAMTGYATSALAVDAMKLGACDFIAKPFTEEQIKSAIDDALASNLAKSGAMGMGFQADGAVTSIQRREVFKVLTRTSEDKRFWNSLMEKGGDALWEYTLTGEAKAAIASGDLAWINENVGELTQKQLMYVFKRLEREVW
ncbi:MAG: response regulator [Desulfobacterium sp.]|nr:response regulator [Desulfobacterium sp.]